MNNCRDKFEIFYNNVAKNIIENHNNQRKNRIKKLVITQICALGLILGFITWLSIAFSFNSVKFGTIIFILALPIIHTVFNLFNPLKTYEADFKRKFMKELLAIFGVFEWHNGMLSSSYIINTNDSIIFPKKFLLSYDDIIYGWFKEKFEVFINECKTERNSFFTILPILIPLFLFTTIISLVIFIIVSTIFINGKTIALTWYNPLTYVFFGIILFPFFVFFKLAWASINRGNFQGIILQCNLPKNFSGITYLYENNPFTNKNIERNPQKCMQKVNLEDIKFNRDYRVYSDNQIEARYVLTSAFISRLYNIKSIFNTKYIRAQFRDNKMLLIIQTGKDLYTFNQYKKLTKSDFEQVFNELYSLFMMLDALKLDVKTGL